MRDRCLFLVDVGGIAQEKSEKRNKVARGYDVMGRDWEKKDGRELREVKEGLEVRVWSCSPLYPSARSSKKSGGCGWWSRSAGGSSGACSPEDASLAPVLVPQV